MDAIEHNRAKIEGRMSRSYQERRKCEAVGPGHDFHCGSTKPQLRDKGRDF